MQVSVLIAVVVCFVLLFGCSGHSELVFAVPFHLHGYIEPYQNLGNVIIFIFCC